jgi:hypothetical protein
MTLRILTAALAALALAASPAGAGTLPVIGGDQLHYNMSTSEDASGNKTSHTVVCDNANPTTCDHLNPDGSITTSGVAFQPSGKATLAATSVSGNIAFPSAGPTALIYNSGTADAFVTFGTSSSVTATAAAGLRIQAGATVALNIGSNTYVAATAAAGGATTLEINTGVGTPIVANPGMSQDQSTFTAGAAGSVFAPAGGVYNDNIAGLSQGAEGEARVTQNRGVHVNLRDSAGNELGATLTGQQSPPLQVAIAPGLAPPAPPAPFAAPPAATVKAAKQSASAYDQAQVVALSPTPSPQCPFVAPVNQTASATVITGKPGLKIYICTLSLRSATQQGVSFSEGTGSNCGTGTLFLDGGSGGTKQYLADAGEDAISPSITLPLQNYGDNFCILQSGTGNVSGRIVYGLY